MFREQIIQWKTNKFLFIFRTDAYEQMFRLEGLLKLRWKQNKQTKTTNGIKKKKSKWNAQLGLNKKKMNWNKKNNVFNF